MSAVRAALPYAAFAVALACLLCALAGRWRRWAALAAALVCLASLAWPTPGGLPPAEEERLHPFPEGLFFLILAGFGLAFGSAVRLVGLGAMGAARRLGGRAGPNRR